MTLIALCSVKGSPGVTTAALALAARWPEGGRPVMVECDPAGGDLLARFRLRAAPGLVSLAAAARGRDVAQRLWEHVQRLPGGLAVIAGPVGGQQARAALGELGAHGGGALLHGGEAVLVADCGRVEADSAAWPVLRAADAVLLCTGVRDDGLAHVAAKLALLERWASRPELLLIGDGYTTGEVARTLRIGVAGRLPYDVKGAAPLAGRPGARAIPARSQLGRAAARLARRMALRTDPGQDTPQLEDASRAELPGGATASVPGGKP
ncbi:MinD/ParA family ATP-binding protein [Streptomyces boninensis]|uniref:MinD/ParA family ATP-binding protein n=1 Tax=Streptomyces boninensis TaxID=2039455 RepID=UPI003B222765